MNIRPISLICAFALLSACQSVGKDASADKAIDTLKLDAVSWSNQSTSNGKYNDNWLENLNDPRLKKYVDIALRNNFSLQANAAQLEAQLKSARISAARQWPSIDVSLRNNRVENEANTDLNNGSSSNDTSTVNSTSSYTGNINISWEVDIWQRLGAQKKASIRTAQANAADYQAARFSLVAAVARAWFNLNSFRLQIDVAEKRLSTIKESLEVVEEQYKSGSQSALNVYLNRSDFANQQSNILDLKNSLRTAIRDFRILLGEYPKIDLEFEAMLPTLEADVPAGLPAELVMRRPDVVADLYEWQSSAFDASAAQRARYPSFSLTASYGASSDSLNTLDEKTLLWNVLNNLSLPLFQGGQLKAQAEASQYLQDASFKLYLATLLRSFNEVETALSTEKTLKARLQLINDATTLAQSGYELALDQYREGISSYQDLLESRRRWFDFQTQLITLENGVLQNRISLNLALGGDFDAPKIALKVNKADKTN